MTDTTMPACSCRNVAFTVEGRPIMTVECMCTSCRTAGAVFESLPGAPKLLEHSGATHFVLYRKDRVRCTSGASHIKQFRLSPTSKTRRLVATCCNTPLLLEFSAGHWLSMYARTWPAGTRPRAEMRTMVSDLPEGTQLPDDIPNCKTQSPRFMLKLLGAWIAMGFRVPKLDYVHGVLERDPERTNSFVSPAAPND